MEEIYTASAEVYDVLYQGVIDYPGIAEQLTALIRARKPDARRVLEAGCGTGLVLEQLQMHFEVSGFDLSEDMLRIARAKLPRVALRRADMADFDWGAQFDAIVCVFSSIGYMTTLAQLATAYARFAAHLPPGGVAIVEAWFPPAAFIPGYVGAETGGDETFRVHRVNTSWLEDGGRVSVMDMHHLVGRPDGVTHFVERHRMGLFTPDEHLGALDAAGFDAEHDPDLFLRRGTYLGVRRG